MLALMSSVKAVMKPTLPESYTFLNSSQYATCHSKVDEMLIPTPIVSDINLQISGKQPRLL